MTFKKLSSLVIVLIFLVASCGNPPPSNQNVSIEIQVSGTESKILEVETIPQPNCTGTAEVENQVQKSRTIEHVMEIQNGTSVNANGQIGFAGTDIELGATVASQFGQSYGTSETLTRSITVKAGIGTNMLHTIQQVEIWKVGQAKISVGGQQTIIPFKFRSDFAIELVNSRNQGICGTLPTTPTGQNQEPTAVTSNPTSAPVTEPTISVAPDSQYFGWVICWHGRDGYEYLIAYPESDVKQGVDLKFNLTNAQGRQVEVANDSLKMCYINGEWYGYPDPSPWFPTVSYIKFLDREFLVCSDSPGCQGSQWTMLPEKYFPSNAPELQAPKEAGIHIIVYK